MIILIRSRYKIWSYEVIENKSFFLFIYGLILNLMGIKCIFLVINSSSLIRYRKDLKVSVAIRMSCAQAFIK